MNRTTVNEELKRQKNRTPAASNKKENRAHSLRRNENRSSVKNCSSSSRGPKTPRLGEGMRSRIGICPDSSHVCKGEPSSRASSRLSPTSAASSNMPGGWPSEHADSPSQTSSNLDSQRSSGTCSRLKTAMSGGIPPHARRMPPTPDHSGAEDLSRQQAAYGYRERTVVSSPISRDRDGDIIMMESGASVSPITGKAAHPVTIRRKAEATSSKYCVSARQSSKNMPLEPLTKENTMLPVPVVMADELSALVPHNRSQQDKLSEVDLAEKPKQKVRFASLPKPCSPTSRPATRPPTPALAPRPDADDFQYGCDSSEAALCQNRRMNPSLASFTACEARKEPDDALPAPELPVTPTTPSLPLSPSVFDPLGDINSAPAEQQDINNSPTREHAAGVIADRAGLSYKPSATSGAEDVTESAGWVQTTSWRFSETQASWYYPRSTSSSMRHPSVSPDNEGPQHTFVCCHCDGPILLSSLERHRCSPTPSSTTDHTPYSSSIRAGPCTNPALPDLPLPVPNVRTPSQSFYGKCPPARDITRQRLHDKLQREYEAESPTIAKNRQTRAECDIELSKEVAKKEGRVEEKRVKAIKEEETKEQKKKEKALPRIPDVSDPQWRSRRMQTLWERDAFSAPSNGVSAEVVGAPASRIKQTSAPKKEEGEAPGVGAPVTEHAPAHRSTTAPISIPTPTPTKTPSTSASASTPTNLPLRAKAPTSETKQDATPPTIPPPTNNNLTLHAAPSPRPTPAPTSNTTPPLPPRDASPPYAPPPPHQAPRLTPPQKAAIQPSKSQPQVDSIAGPEVTAIAKQELGDILLSPTIDNEDEDWMRIDEETDAGEEWEVVE